MQMGSTLQIRSLQIFDTVLSCNISTLKAEAEYPSEAPVSTCMQVYVTSETTNTTVWTCLVPALFWERQADKISREENKWFWQKQNQSNFLSFSYLRIPWGINCESHTGSNGRCFEAQMARSLLTKRDDLSVVGIRLKAIRGSNRVNQWLIDWNINMPITSGFGHR